MDDIVHRISYQRNVLVLTQLVSEILDFRKVQNGKMELRLSDFNLAESMKQWIKLFSASAQKKHITISMDALIQSCSEQIKIR